MSKREVAASKSRQATCKKGASKTKRPDRGQALDLRTPSGKPLPY